MRKNAPPLVSPGGTDDDEDGAEWRAGREERHEQERDGRRDEGRDEERDG